MKNLNSYQVGDYVFLEMMRPKEGTYPVARAENGMMAFIAKQKGQKTFYEYGSTWLCEIIEVHDRHIVIQPIEEEITAAENAFIAKKLANEAFNKKKEHKKRPKINYPFKASYEK